MSYWALTQVQKAENSIDYKALVRHNTQTRQTGAETMKRFTENRGKNMVINDQSGKPS